MSLVAVIASLAFTTSAVASTAKVTRPQIRAYVTSVEQPYLLFQVGELHVTAALLDASGLDGYAGVERPLFKAESSMRLAIKRLARVKAPGDLGASQRDLLIGLRMVASDTHLLAVAYRDNEDFDFAADALQAAEDTSAESERSWGGEITVVLRRLQMAVPLWVKKTGR